MSNVLSFVPRRPASAPAAPLAPSPADVRRQIEEAAQAALDTADRLIALLDQIEGDVEREDGADAEPSLGAPEGHASQIVWLRGSSSDIEQDSAR
ncbi:hypothetical protein MKK58_04445 [Methylobacterium sp. J-078]|uniref:hypothetical protein n=1 Tax=Methylobacterium sp. J-078 TaxID=2836657 RepID=UPI001FBB8D24|nr:hypothetical protein [Methylobacterium sp. J-078]MCJ2043787.1 hypothetical protein [Methylobacterium sp. J-078]